MSWYRDGEITGSAGNPVITGVNTNWLDNKQAIGAGQALIISVGDATQVYEIAQVESATQIRLTSPLKQDYFGEYAILTFYIDSVPDFARKLSSIIGYFQGQLTGLQELVTSDNAVDFIKPDGTSIKIPSINSLTKWVTEYQAWFDNAREEIDGAATNAAEAKAARDAAVQAKLDAIAAAAGVEEYAQESKKYANQAAASAQSASASETSAAAALTGANNAKTDAEAARDEAVTASTTSKANADITEANKTASEAAKADAETARDVAVTAKNDTVTASAEAVQAKTDAATSRDEAAKSATDAATAKTGAESARDIAVSAKDSAEASKEGAEVARDRAEAAARKAEDITNAADIDKVVELVNGKMDKKGGAFTGPVQVAADAVKPLEPVTKQQLDTEITSLNERIDSVADSEEVANLLAEKMDKKGGTFTGPVVLAGDATKPLEPTTKQQLDSEIQAVTDKLDKMGGGYLGMVDWHPMRSEMPFGRIAADGQELDREVFASLFERVSAGKLPVCEDSLWLSDSKYRGFYTLGNGTTTFRIPDYNGKTKGSLGAGFLRGDGLNSLGENGLIQSDAIRNITGYSGGWCNAITASSGGALATDAEMGRFNNGGANAAAWAAVRNTSFDASRVVPTAADNHPVNITGCFTIQYAGAVLDEGEIEVGKLANAIADLSNRVAALEAGGSADELLGKSNTWTGANKFAGAFTVAAPAGSPEGGQIDLSDKDGNGAYFIDIDAGGNFRVVRSGNNSGVTTSVMLQLMRATNDTWIRSTLNVDGPIKATGSISAGNAAIGTDGNVVGPIWSGGSLASHLSTVGGVKSVARGANAAISWGYISGVQYQDTHVPVGCYINGMQVRRSGGTASSGPINMINAIFYRPIMINDGARWLQVGDIA